MALVEYSESDSSDIETHPKSHVPPGDNKKLHKAAFQKVVDRSNPHKILVNLPETSKSTNATEEGDEEPLAKRVKVGLSSFSGFNSILPAPKKPSTIGRGNSGSDGHKSGLRSGVSLKTGATPGFDREAPAVEGRDGFDDEVKENVSHTESVASSSANLPPASSAESSDLPKPEPILKGNPMMFKPLSVTRKTKKKPSTTTNEELLVKAQTPVSTGIVEPASKVSLFPAAAAEAPPVVNLSFSGQYQPLIYGPSSSSNTTLSAAALSEGKTNEDAATIDTGQNQREYKSSSHTSQSLNNIAEDLKLSASAKRQLLGRHRNDPFKVNLVNFNIDQEYATNEILRQAGEQVQHNPVRAIAPGKHSLKQLVNAVSSQKEALEEHFATGKRNKKEAGSKYGW